MKIYIASDHGGFELKAKLTEFINTNYSFQVEDLGALELDPADDYPVYAKALSQKVVATPESFGILICKTGVGMSIAANRFQGIFAALCTTKDHAIRSRQHENANVICLDSEFIDFETNLEIVKLFLNTPFSNEERHVRRIKMID